ncbi:MULTISPECIES: hypothetical protein [unclassified Oceanobacter]|uniref:hypothetical protein n=1 Tax=unclassified Oceanobacter TaxID=2620260 RepID=UPI0027333E0B|nr:MULTISPECIES: hypothetical protein [unclassified Oceanobacter]MDP2608033.1 hypothetical protein [Oceanobacter sp. 1_MG-2023]MDP2611305.1 hypothetical protein [Oceanobacter sp. 2_MG-2023]
MKNLAQWAMQSRQRVTLVAAIAYAVPMLFWLGAAFQALVLLRQPSRDSLPMVLWSSLPALAWMAAGDPTPVLVAAGTILAAQVLRYSIRLDWAILTAVVLGELIYWCLPLLLADVLPLVVSSSEVAVSEALKSSPDLQARLQPLVAPMIHGVLAALHTLVIILCLLLGRYWQSALYNPKGFGIEFRQLRLPLAFTLPAVLVVFTAGQLLPGLSGMVPVLTVAMMLAGLAVFHGVVHGTNASSNWLLPIYIGLVVFGPYMYTLLIFVAVLDSVLDIRMRLKDTASGDK